MTRRYAIFVCRLAWRDIICRKTGLYAVEGTLARRRGGRGRRRVESVARTSFAPPRLRQQPRPTRVRPSLLLFSASIISTRNACLLPALGICLAHTSSVACCVVCHTFYIPYNFLAVLSLPRHYMCATSSPRQLGWFAIPSPLGPSPAASIRGMWRTLT